jgi:hypothetical protein
VNFKRQWTQLPAQSSSLYQARWRVSVWTGGTPEQFIMHIQQASNAIKHKGLKEAYKKLVVTKKECTGKLEEAHLSLEISQSKVKEDSAQAKAVKMTTEAYNKAKESVTSVAYQIF